MNNTLQKLNFIPFIQIRFSKRERFVSSVIILSLCFFVSENFPGKFGIFITLLVSFLSSLLFFLSVYKDVKGDWSYHIFILPFLYTLSFGFFYFLVPSRFLTQTPFAFLYGVGLYSLYLAQNIFIVASVRTIALLSGARIVSFIITLLSYLFIVRIIFSIDMPFFVKIIIVPFLVFVVSFLLIYQSIWTITLEKSIQKNSFWSLILSICLAELSLVLLFWPVASTFLAIFLTGFFYTVVGLSHAWFDKRLFRGVLWEYIWVTVIVLTILFLFTLWKPSFNS